MNGILRCSRYSFGPNRLHYCGPDANAELLDYIKAGEKDLGLINILKEFKTLYPYLCHIAKTNKIKNPFDSQVVEAYWIGNELLEKNEQKKLRQFFVDDLSVKKMFGIKEFERVEEKIGAGAVPHHSFHVFNLWRKSGSMNAPHDLRSLDECRVNSGIVVRANGPEITVLAEPLIYLNGKFFLGEPIEKKLIRSLESEYEIEQLKPGQIISFHWSVPCEVISDKQAAALKKYTLQSIAFANRNI